MIAWLRTLPICFIVAATSYAEELTKDEWAKRFNSAADAVEAKYPELKHAESQVSVLLDYKIRKAQASRDPALKDPYYIVRFADDVVNEMKDLGMELGLPTAPQEDNEDNRPIAIVPPSPKPSSDIQSTSPSRKLSPAEQEVQDYLKKVQAGQAGINPKLQTRARSGDPYAQAEVQRNHSLNEVNARVAEGEITEEAALAERSAIHADYTARIQQIQSAQQHEELMDELRKRRR